MKALIIALTMMFGAAAFCAAADTATENGNTTVLESKTKTHKKAKAEKKAKPEKKENKKQSKPKKGKKEKKTETVTDL